MPEIVSVRHSSAALQRQPLLLLLLRLLLLLLPQPSLNSNSKREKEYDNKKKGETNEKYIRKLKDQQRQHNWPLLSGQRYSRRECGIGDTRRTIGFIHAGHYRLPAEMGRRKRRPRRTGNLAHVAAHYLVRAIICIYSICVVFLFS